MSFYCGVVQVKLSIHCIVNRLIHVYVPSKSLIYWRAIATFFLLFLFVIIRRTCLVNFII